MSDQAVDIAEPTQEAPDTGASVVPEAAPADTASQDAAQWPWSKEHPEWGPEDQYKAYNEMRTRLSRGEHLQQPEAAPEPEQQDPWSQLPPEDDERTVRQLVNLFGTSGGQPVLDWIDQNPGYVSDQTRDQFYQAWLGQNPWQAQQYAFNHFYGGRESEFTQQFTQQLEPVTQHVQAQINAAAINAASQVIPEWETWAPRIIEYLEQNPMVLNDVKTSPDLLAERMGDIYGMLAYRASRTQPAPPRNGTTAAKPPRTSTTRSTASPEDQADRRNAELENLKRMRGK